MILNEDFFNDIDIKDEDLTAEVLTDEEPVEEPVKEYNEKTSRELIEHKMSESEMVLMIYINLFSEEFDIWHRIERIMKRVKYMFNIYNISLSEPFITYKRLSFNILRNKIFPDKKDNYTIIQHKGCNLYFPECELREYGIDGTIKDEYLRLFVFLDKKVPVFKTARSAYNFIIGLDKCIWKDAANYYEYECFDLYGLYNIDDIYFGNEVIQSFSDNNSYVTDNARVIFETILRLVPKELSKKLRNINIDKFAHKSLTKEDLKEIIKLADQQKTY